MPIVISEVTGNVDSNAGSEQPLAAGVQTALVVDNKDPDKMGRVKVSFPWDAANTNSFWARVVQPMAGNNYGVYFVPEVGDEVLVAFSNNNHDHPIVLGSLYNGQAKQATSADDNNYIKNIKTKAGNEIKFTDKPGEEEVLIISKTNSDNQIILTLKDNGKITIQSKGKIELTAPEIDLSADKKFSIKGGEISITGTKISMKADADFEMEGAQSKLKGSGSLNLSAPQIQMKADAQLDIDGGAMATVKSSGMMTVQSSGETAIKGAIVMIN